MLRRLGLLPLLAVRVRPERLAAPCSGLIISHRARRWTGAVGRGFRGAALPLRGGSGWVGEHSALLVPVARLGAGVALPVCVIGEAQPTSQHSTVSCGLLEAGCPSRRWARWTTTQASGTSRSRWQSAAGYTTDFLMRRGVLRVRCGEEATPRGRREQRATLHISVGAAPVCKKVACIRRAA